MILSITKNPINNDLLLKFDLEDKEGNYMIIRGEEITNSLACFAINIDDLTLKHLTKWINFYRNKVVD